MTKGYKKYGHHNKKEPEIIPEVTQLFISDPQGFWTAKVVLDIPEGETFDFSAWKALRLPQTDTTATIPQTLAGEVQLKSIRFAIPEQSDGNQIFIPLNDTSPKLPVVVDNPHLHTASNKDIQLVAREIDLQIELNASKWSIWVDTSNVVMQQGENAKAITVNSLITKVFALPNSGSSILQFTAGGLILHAQLSVPWRPNSLLPGTFRLTKENNVFGLEQPNAGAWREDLLDWQDALIDASDQQLDDGIPSVDGSAVGLIASPIPINLEWKYTPQGELEFQASDYLFELEVRGSAQGAARVKPNGVQLLQGGMEIAMNGGEVSTSSERITYTFKRTTQQRWSGSFKVHVEDSSARRLLSSKVYENWEEDEIPVWILTSQGPMKLALGTREELINEPEDLPDWPQLMRGILRLSKVGWLETPDKVLVPDLASEDQGSMYITNFMGFDVRLKFVLENNEYLLDSCQLDMWEPILRVEKMLPVYLPGNDDKPFDLKPPKLPTPGDNSEQLFFPLSFERLDAAEDQRYSKWKMELDFIPGRQGETLEEGSWNDTLIGLNNTSVNNYYTMYWYALPDALLLPELPYYGNPGKEPLKINQERLYMPLRPAVNSVLHFKPSHSTYTPLVKHGVFHVPTSESESLFRLVPLQLPGISIVFPKTSVHIRDGRLYSGKLMFAWSHELPIISEVYALQVPQEDTGEKDIKGWWEQMEKAWQLSISQDATMVQEEVDIHPQYIVSLDDALVTIHNLLGTGNFNGSVDLNLLQNKALLHIKNTTGKNIPLIAQEHLLQGATGQFEAQEGTANGAIDIQPKENNDSWQLKAGVMTPSNLQSGRYADQFGFQFEKLPTPQATRKVNVFANEQYTAYQLWSYNALDFSGAGFECSCYFQSLPLQQEQNEWVFDDAMDNLDDKALREYQWGILGTAIIDGFYFQPFELKRVRMEEDSTTGMLTPLALECTGVLHFREASLQKADKNRQLVQLKFKKENNQWIIEHLTGSVWWPLFATSPDLSDARGKLNQRPAIASIISYDNGVVFGTSNQPATLSFDLLGSTWTLPCTLKRQLQTKLEWELIPPENPVGMYAKEGLVVQHRTLDHHLSNVQFSLTEKWEGAVNNLLELDFDYSFSKDVQSFALTSAKVLQQDNHYLLSANDTSLFENSIGIGKMVLTLNATSDSYFELLPEWSIAKETDLHVYVSLHFKQVTHEAITNSPVQSLNLLLESRLAPNDMHVKMEYLLDAGQRSLELALTGQLNFSNGFYWKKGEDLYRHSIRCFVLDAVLSGDDLITDSGSSYFNYPETKEGIAIAVLADHQITHDGEKMLSWTAPHTIRLMKPKGYAERINQLQAYFTALGDETRMSVFDNKMIQQINQLSDVVLVDASEAFWLGQMEGLSENRTATTLWENQASKVQAIPVYRKDYQQVDRWVRMEMPFIAPLEGEFDAAWQDVLQLEWITDAKEAQYQPDVFISSKELFHHSIGKPLNLPDWGILPLQLNKSAEAELPHLFQPDLSGYQGWLVMDKKELFAGQVESSGLVVPGIIQAADYSKSHRIKLYNLDDDDDDEVQLFGKSDMISYDLSVSKPGHYMVVFKAMSKWSNARFGVQLDDDMIQVLDLPKGKDWKSISAYLPFTQEQHTLKVFPIDRYFYLDQIAINEVVEIPYLLATKAADYTDKGKHVKVGKDKSYVELSTGWNSYVTYDIQVPKTGYYLLTFEAKGYSSSSHLRCWIDQKNEVRLKLHNRSKYQEHGFWIKLNKGKRELKIRAYWKKFYLKSWTLRSFSDPVPMQPDLPVSALQYAVDKWDKEILAWHEKANTGDSPTVLFRHSSFAFPKALPKSLSTEEEINLSLEMLVPASANQWTTQNAGWVRQAEKQFAIGITDNESWIDILFGKQGQAPESSVRQRLLDWVVKQQRSNRQRLSPLLRATTYTKGTHLEPLVYFLLTPEAETPATSVQPLQINTDTVVPEIHLENRAQVVDTLSQGSPDYRKGDVYYVPEERIAPSEEFAVVVSGWPIKSFTSSEEIVLQGQSAILSWTLEEDVHLLILEEENSEKEWQVSQPTSTFEVIPERTGRYTLHAYNAQMKEIAYAQMMLPLTRLVSGSGVGLSYKLGGIAAGREHQSRLAFADNNESQHAWLEMNREVSFHDLTRNDATSANESGWLLPANRTLQWPEDGGRNSKKPLLPVSHSVLYAGGRSGAKHRINHAFLFENHAGQLYRGTSQGFHLRMARPVELPPLYDPIPAVDESKGQREQRLFRTCRVYDLEPTIPFVNREIYWQDPLYNKQLIAVANQLDRGICSLVLDRKIYAGKDLFYPEIHINTNALPTANWQLIITFSVKRKVYGVFETIGERRLTINRHGVHDAQGVEWEDVKKELLTKDKWRYVFEIGINEPLAADDHFNFAFRHDDKMEADLQFIDLGVQENLFLTASINTREEVWPTPSHGYVMVRKTKNPVETKNTLAAFGWMPRPVIIKRKDKFDITSWYASFTARDTYIPQPEDEEQFEVRTITPYGEQKMAEIKWED